ncbi:DUF4760 domain-containing protein [Pseudomonas putida]|uniref:DUF4760 domain-containing protein n=1 Tax=Pseudomonas putida TaxID=303 RepID=UPI00062A1FDF|nr:DUF4760 domain-containing protein [Pseudomonas putida]
MKRHGFYQGLLLATFVALVVVALFRNFDTVQSVLAQQNLNEWVAFGIFASLSALLINQLYSKIYQKYHETRVGIAYVAISFFVVMVATYIVLRSDVGAEYQTSLALFVSSSLLGAGWWVQATISTAAARKSHTVNTIMNQRNSELFNQKNDNLISVFPRKKTIHPIFSEYLMDPHNKKFKDAKFPPEFIEAAKDLSYVLNYYEFIAVGVTSGDFDEKLAKECFVGILTGLEKRAYLVILSAQKIQNKKTFEKIVELVDKWTDKKSLVTLSSSNQSIDTFEVYPTQEEVDKMLCAAITPNAPELTVISNQPAGGNSEI